MSDAILVGLYFHVFGKNRKVQYQGTIRGVIDERYVLVQYFEWIAGEPNTLEVIPKEAISKGATTHDREEGSWQFYTSPEQMNEWYHSHQSSHHAN